MAMIKEVPAIDYYSLSIQLPKNDLSISQPAIWDSNHHSDWAFTNSDSCNSSLTSPTDTEESIFPINTYGLAREALKVDIKSEQAFNFGSFEDWMRWDDPSDAALSPTPEFIPELKIEPSTTENPEGVAAGRTSIHTNNREDSVEFCGDNLSEEPLFQSPALQNPLKERVYSDSLSWSQALPYMESTNGYGSCLTPEQEARLRDIAMPSTRSRPVRHRSGFSMLDEADVDNHRKRKNSLDDDDDDEDDSRISTSAAGNAPPVKKTAHNMIEKRYRTNLNDKIAALRDSVPSLRVMSNKNSRGEETKEDLQGLTPAHKLNKATVLSKATEYITHLEKGNKYLTRENVSLKSRIDAFEILILSRQQALNPPSTQRSDYAAGRPRGAGCIN